jgi:hypothetical protein
MKNWTIIILVFFHLSTLVQNSCEVNNQAFKASEQLDYKIYYNWGVIWMAAGETGFNTSVVNQNGRYAYHFVGVGATYPKYDWFYKVRDKYESYADTMTLKPLRFIREGHEGSSYTFDDYIFNQSKNKVYTAEKRNKKNTKLDSIKITSCTNDVLTAVFYARCLDFSKYKSNDTIPLTFVLDGKVYPSYIRYLGKETITTELLGTVRCIKFRPKLIIANSPTFKSGCALE